MAATTVPAVGIDLGTTYSCVAVFRQGQVEIIPNESGNRTTPSYVAFTDDMRLMGEAAKSQAPGNAANTIYDAKRLIGREWSDEAVQRDVAGFPFRVAQKGEGGIELQVEWRGETKSFQPEEISAMILTKLKDDASTYLGGEVTDAVVTVPAYFNDTQRAATKLAGTIAGLNVRRIINEPTAAAIAYGLDRKAAASGIAGGRKHVLIFDLGGGTFDVSLLAIEDGVFEVKATNGDTHLGGEDFDDTCVEHFAREFQRMHKADMRPNARSMRRLRNAVERAKRVLSTATTTTVQVDSLFSGEDFEAPFTRAKFEELNMVAFKRLLRPVENVLADAKMKRQDVDDVVLVGGSTRIPKVQELLQGFFSGKELCKSINPDEAVAHGAAVQAAILTGHGGAMCQDLLLLDVTPLSLGIEVTGKVMSVIIKRNTPIPFRKSDTYTTNEDNQTSVDIDIYEGERPQTQYNHLLGHFELTGIPPAKRGVPQIEVTFDIDANGILNVSAVEKTSGSKGQVTITNKTRGTDEEAKRMMADAERFKADDEETANRQAAHHSFQEYIYSVREALDNLADKFESCDIEDKAEEVSEMSQTDLDWLDDEPTAPVDDVKARQKALESKWNSIMETLQRGPVKKGRGHR